MEGLYHILLSTLLKTYDRCTLLLHCVIEYFKASSLIWNDDFYIKAHSWTDIIPYYFFKKFYLSLI